MSKPLGTASRQRLASLRSARQLMRIVGVFLLLALTLLVWDKLRAGEPYDLLWICYPAAALLCLGLLIERPLLAAAGGLFYLAVGLPYWLVGLILVRETSLGSVAVHLTAPVAGLLHVRRAGLPRSAKWLVIPFYFALAAVCRLFTPRGLNVNLVFGPYVPMPIPAWVSFCGNVILGVGLLFVAERLLVRLNRSSEKRAMPQRSSRPSTKG
jgi:hypothetical protein